MSNNVKIQLPNGQTASIVKESGQSVSVSAPSASKVAVTSSVYQIHDSHYAFTQTVSTETWDITHNLSKHPSVTVIDSANNVVVGEVRYESENRLIITFNDPFKGKAYLN